MWNSGSNYLKFFISIIGIFVAFACIAFLIPGEEPLYGQRGNKIPDLIGEWSGGVYGGGFEDVWSADAPVFGGDDTVDMTITHQEGRFFCGGGENYEDKITGVLMEDGTVHVQLFDTSNMERVFGIGKLIRRKGHLIIRVSLNIYRELSEESPYMFTGVLTLHKQ